MSLTKLKSIQSVAIQTEYKNILTSGGWESIGKSESKAKGKNKNFYKFSQFDMECNLFRCTSNTFTGNIRIRTTKHSRCKIFQESKSMRGKARVTHVR